jgi:uncharacterized protein (DUF488 family)
MEHEVQNVSETRETQVPHKLDLKALSTTLDIIDVRILKEFYYLEPSPFVFKYLYQKFTKYGWKERTIRDRVHRLAKRGLIEIVPKTNPMCILPVKRIEASIRVLVMAMLGKFDLKA